MPGIILVLSLLVIEACYGIPFLNPQMAPTSLAAPEITFCGGNPLSLCVDSFGMEDANRMLISFVNPDYASTPDLYLKIQYADRSVEYQCNTVKESPSSVYCTGEVIPLGASIDIAAYSSNTNKLIAEGSFVVNGVAIPTSMIEAPTLTPEAGTSPATINATQPGSPATATFVPTPLATSTPIRITPTSNSYPNP